jgi:hypothetical protein
MNFGVLNAKVSRKIFYFAYLGDYLRYLERLKKIIYSNWLNKSAKMTLENKNPSGSVNFIRPDAESF